MKPGDTIFAETDARPGHTKKTLEQQLVELLENGPMTLVTIYKALAFEDNGARAGIRGVFNHNDKGLFVRTGRGEYRLAEAGDSKADTGLQADVEKKINALGDFIVFMGFCDGIGKVIADGKYGLVDLNGGCIVIPQYDDIRDFYDGRAAVKRDEEWGFINREGAVVIDIHFSEVTNFCRGTARVSNNGQSEIINTNGKHESKTQEESLRHS